MTNSEEVSKKAKWSREDRIRGSFIFLTLVAAGVFLVLLPQTFVVTFVVVTVANHVVQMFLDFFAHKGAKAYISSITRFMAIVVILLPYAVELSIKSLAP